RLTDTLGQLNNGSRGELARSGRASQLTVRWSMAKEALNQGEIETLLNELETKMNRLRTVYEQYFMGIERTPPTTLRKEVFRIVQRMENVYIRNTAQKFRLRSLVQRFNSYKSYWGRVERQIEEGTYQRDINRAN